MRAETAFSVKDVHLQLWEQPSDFAVGVQSFIMANLEVLFRMDKPGAFQKC